VASRRKEGQWQVGARKDSNMWWKMVGHGTWWCLVGAEQLPDKHTLPRACPQPPHPAHHQALEVQFGGDAQREVAAKGVMVGDKGAGIGAASRRLQHWGLHLQEV
jgi:hypothetical protein